MKEKRSALAALEEMRRREREAFNQLMESDAYKLSDEAAHYLIVASANQETLMDMVASLIRDSVDSDDVSRRVYTGPRER